MAALQLLFTECMYTITVYTFKGGEILEKQCEATGWPNVTTDGEIMYENTFSTDRAIVVQWAHSAAQSSIRSCRDRIQELEADLAKARGWLKESLEDLEKLEAQIESV